MYKPDCPYTHQTEEPECTQCNSIGDKFKTRQNDFMVSKVTIWLKLWWGFMAGTNPGNMGIHRVSSGVSAPSSGYVGVFAV